MAGRLLRDTCPGPIRPISTRPSKTRLCSSSQMQISAQGPDGKSQDPDSFRKARLAHLGYSRAPKRYQPPITAWGKKRPPPRMDGEPARGLCRPTFDRGDFRSLGDQACAAERSYSAWRCSRFLSPSETIVRARAGRPGPGGGGRIPPSPDRRFLSSACGRDQALADPSRRADPSGSQF
jgi:hypothetical protein